MTLQLLIFITNYPRTTYVLGTSLLNSEASDVSVTHYIYIFDNFFWAGHPSYLKSDGVALLYNSPFIIWLVYICAESVGCFIFLLVVCSSSQFVAKYVYDYVFPWLCRYFHLPEVYDVYIFTLVSIIKLFVFCNLFHCWTPLMVSSYYVLDVISLSCSPVYPSA